MCVGLTEASVPLTGDMLPPGGGSAVSFDLNHVQVAVLPIVNFAVNLEFPAEGLPPSPVQTLVERSGPRVD